MARKILAASSQSNSIAHQAYSTSAKPATTSAAVAVAVLVYPAEEGVGAGGGGEVGVASGVSVDSVAAGHVPSPAEHVAVS